VGMGIIPLCFKAGEDADSFGLTGHERFNIELPTNLSEIRPGQDVTVTTDNGKSFTCTLRFDTEVCAFQKHRVYTCSYQLLCLQTSNYISLCCCRWSCHTSTKEVSFHMSSATWQAHRTKAKSCHFDSATSPSFLAPCDGCPAWLHQCRELWIPGPLLTTK
jgi:hypothetical protein